MKNNTIKNTISGIMLILGVAIQIASPEMLSDNTQQLQSCNHQFIDKIEQRISKISLHFNLNQFNSNTQIKKGE